MGNEKSKWEVKVFMKDLKVFNEGIVTQVLKLVGNRWQMGWEFSGWASVLGVSENYLQTLVFIVSSWRWDFFKKLTALLQFFFLLLRQKQPDDGFFPYFVIVLSFKGY